VRPRSPLGWLAVGAGLGLLVVVGVVAFSGAGGLGAQDDADGGRRAGGRQSNASPSEPSGDALAVRGPIRERAKQAAAFSEVERPNLLLVVADDLGQDQIGAYGLNAKAAETPRIDALADEGILFRNVIADPVCSPTRATILTGRYAYRYGVGNAIPLRPGWGLPAGETVLARPLRAQGYHSAVVGKWHLATPDMGGLDHVRSVGFDHHLGTMGNLLGNVVGTERLMTYTDWNYVQDGQIAPNGAYITTVTTDDALRMAVELPEPWFILVAYNAPHYPMHVPPEGLRRSAVPEAPTEAEMYRLMVESVDIELARLLEGLGERRARTDVVFMGDNGSAPVADGGRLDGRHAKGTVGRGGITVPFIFSGPSARYVGETRSLVNTTDLFATFLQIAGSQGPWPEDAVSVVPVLSDPLAAPRRYAFSERFTPNGMGPWDEHLVAIQDERYKLVLDTGVVDGFYDLVEDPLEHRNLWDDPEAKRRLADVIDRLKWALPDRVDVPKMPTQEALLARGIDLSGAL